MSAPSLKNALLDPAIWRQMSEQLERLLDLEPTAREQWLRELTDTEPAIAELLGRLLAKPKNEYLEQSPFALLGLASPQTSMIGAQIGGYTVESLIGRGGMGAVWLASRSDGRFEGHRAIKFIDSLAARPDLAERFAKEGRLLARLSHPNIARLIDAGMTQDGKQFLVLEYVDGERIDRYCDSNRLSIEARIRLFLGAVSAVAHAHTQLVIHRDLKPSNMLVSGDGSVKLLDFGIAKLLNGGETDGQRTHTRVEESALTPDYAAPEQLLGDVPSTATDVYQLGMLLYVLLTGRHPLQPSASRSERVKAALEDRVPLASETCEKMRRKQLRGDLDAILAKALDGEPARRYSTAAALHEDLVRYLNHEPVSARGGTMFYQLGKFVARHRVVVGVAATAVVALCATLLFAIHQARVATVERDRAVAFASRNEAVTEFLGRVLTDAAASSTPITVTELLARSEKLALSDASGSPENRAAVLGMIAGQYANSDQLARAEPLLAQALQLVDNSLDRALRSRLTCEHAAVTAGAQLWHTEEVMRVLYAEIAQLGDDPRTASHCLHYTALIHLTEQRPAEALRDAQLALDKSRHADIGVLEGTLLGTMAYAHHLSGRGTEAERYFEQAMRKFRELGREQSDDAMVVLNNWAASMVTAGVPRRALELMEQTERIERLRGADAEPSATGLGNRGIALVDLGRFAEARAALDQECQLAARHSDKFSEIHCVSGLASVSLETSNLDQAEQELDRLSRAIASAELPPENRWVRTHTQQSGWLALARGRPAQARAAFEKGLMIGGKGRSSMRAYLGLSAAALALGDAAQAIDSARRALHLAQGLQGDLPYSSHIGLTSLAMGRAQLLAGDRAEARKSIETAVAQLSNTVDADHPSLQQAREELRGM